MSYDVIVLGLGGMGSAAAAHLAARGQRVLGLERFGPAHDQGSSHGGSRITRELPWLEPRSCAGPKRSSPSTRCPRAARCAAAALPMPPSPMTMTS